MSKSSPTKTSNASHAKWSQAERVEFARAAFTSSLFVFAKECLGYDKLYDVHRPWCARAEALLAGYADRTPGYTRRAMTLEPRGTFKSTILTVAFALWALVRHPNLRILIYSAREGNSVNFLHEMQQHMAMNPRFRMCFGDWTEGALIWNQTAVTIAPRTARRKEPSIMAIGRGSEMTSLHFDIALVDDLVTRGDRDSYAEREASKAALKDLEAIMEPDSLVHLVGTHWHYDDAYAWIKNELNPELERSGKAGWDIQSGSVVTGDGAPRFERIIPDLEELKMKRGLIDYYANYMNNPLPPDSQLFSEESLATFKLALTAYKGRRVVAYWDPASSKPQKGKDPDFHCIPVAAEHPDGYCDIIDVWMKQEKPSAGYAQCERYAKDYGLAELRVETNHLPDAADNLEERFRRRHITTAVSGLKNTGAKAARIETLEPLITAGRIRFREDWRTCSPSYRLFIEQLTMYPVAAHDDGPDALEGVYHTLVRSSSPAMYEGPSADDDPNAIFSDDALDHIESLWR